jgi:hypothetical protein
MVRIVQQKELVIFIFCKMFMHETGELVDNPFNFKTVEARCQGVGEILAANKLEIAGKGRAIQVLAEAETDLGRR